MFPSRYFPLRYFAGRYWLPAGFAAVAGPYTIAAKQLFVAGAVAGEVFVAGAVAGQVRTAGAEAGQSLD